MRSGNLARLTASAFLLAGMGVLAQAQNSPNSSAGNGANGSSSVADAARRAREQKQNASSPAKVISDDDLDAKRVQPGQQGLTTATPQLDTQPPSADAVAAQQEADTRHEQAPESDPVKDTDSAKIAHLKGELARAEEDLKLSQREASLAQDTVYAKPDYQRDKAGKAQLDELQQQINDRQEKLDQLKTQLAALEELQKQKGGVPAADKAAAPPQP
jgi:hypothetical protein